MFDKAPLPKHMMLAILAMIVAIMVGGYGLYYHSKKQISQKDKEINTLKESQKQLQTNLSELQKKYDTAANDLTQINKDYDVLVKKDQECKAKQDEIQAKLSEAQKNNETLKKELTDAQVKLGITPQDPTISENAHPMQLLNKKSTDETQAAKVDNTLRCPASSLITKNAPQGNWKENDLNWRVEFTSRPLQDNEAIKDLFKVLYDGHSIACYYSLSPNNDNSTWIVVKGDNKNKQFKLSEKGWQLCPTDECKSQCEKENIKDCSFTLE